MDRHQLSRQKRPAPFSIRLNEAERALLTARAGDLPVATYIKRTVLGGAPRLQRIPKAASHDRDALARCLAALGRSRLADSLAGLARLAETGALFCDEETLASLRRACDDVRMIRDLLMQALGKETPSHPHRLSQSFSDASRVEDDR